MTNKKAPAKGSNNNDNTNETNKQIKKPMLTIENLEQYLNQNGVFISYDIHKKDARVEYTLEHRYEEETMVTSLISDLRSNCSGVSRDIVSSFLDVIALRKKENLVLELIDTTIWDGVDRITEIYENLGIMDDELSKTLVYKWLWQCLALQYNKAGTRFSTRATDFGADGILVLNGEQGLGKTSFFRQVTRVAEGYFKEGGKLNRWNKDHEISALSYWVTELGEIEQSISKNDVENIKAFITRNFDEIRLPYGHKARKTPRTTSLCATCNSQKFLRDVTGNRRFWIVPITKKIDKNWLKNIDSMQVFAQIYYETSVYEINKEECLQGFRLTDEEMVQVNERNRKYEKEVKSENEVADIIADILIRNENPKYIDTTVTKWKEHYPALKRFTANQIGVALSRLGYERKSKRINGNPVQVINLPHF